ncbi:MAG TPA: glycosyl hydrolase 115 family protein [Opitutaceae bacterium]|nr:glycosyl hydrolase 115 family protein [Opitutaceae bacterium]
MKILRSALVFLFTSLGVCAQNRADSAAWVHDTAQRGDFVLVDRARVADLVVAPDDFKVVSLAATDLATDIERVTGRKPALQTTARTPSAPVVLIGTLGGSATIDELVRAGKLDVDDLRGAWESFVIATVENPFPGAPSALVIVGSDRRGTAFGVYELSQAIGVSPWHWWADVPPAKKSALYVAAGTRRFGPPSVKYRGLFINDEDWGLEPWAAKTFDPERGNLGPKTYARVFELLLRLKANTLWPAMHACSTPFNAIPENAPLADDYAIVMGSSHAEPMLRNNVGEWPHDRAADYNYITNREGVRAYWDERVRTNGRFENIYTLGMRGIHDSNMQGPKTDAQRIATLEQIFADQRAMLAEHVRRDVEHVPQIFCAYKEVLGLYRQGLRVPDDVTIVWPDDNFGYIRNYASPDELKRAGGFGIYYHLSYLGAPLSYLWLYTTPPALVWEEMTKAYDYGAHTLWIANAGDIKPAEIGLSFFLELAWDVHRWNRENLPDFFRDWATRQFGPAHATEIAGILRTYFQLNYARKPEHLQWWLPGQPPHASPLSLAEIQQRLAAAKSLTARADALLATVPPEQRDAVFELVVYPARGAALANERCFYGELAVRSAADSAQAKNYADAALAADAQLKEETRVFNEQIAGGKWRGIMNLEPADTQWRTMRIAPWTLPKFSDAPAAATDDARPRAFVALEAEHFTDRRAGARGAWEIVPGLGRTGDGSVAVFPTTAASVDPARIASDAPRLDYAIALENSGAFAATFYLIPTQPIRAGRGLRLAFALDDQPPQEVVVGARDDSTEWAQGVLDATLIGRAKFEFASPGAHTLHVYGVDPGVVLDKIVLDAGGLPPSYLGPPETRPR